MRVDTWTIPIFVLNGKEELPKEGSYYIVASNGVFIRQDQGLFSVTKKIDHCPAMLEEFKASNVIEYDLPPIPAELVSKIKVFFAKVVAEYKAESCVLLYYNRTTQDYLIYIPEQTVSYGGVQYTRKGMATQFPDYCYVGTIHSHCDFQSFHSGTDLDDELGCDGIHITFGHNQLDVFTITSSITCGDQRCEVDPTQVLEGVVANTKKGYFEITNPLDGFDDLSKWMDMVSPMNLMRRKISIKTGEKIMTSQVEKPEQEPIEPTEPVVGKPTPESPENIPNELDTEEKEPTVEE